MATDRSAIIALIGPTAIGKTELSLDIAADFSCEIIGVDSMQVYRYMDIGTAKPSIEERGRVPHHLIDVADPDEDYSVGRYVVDANQAIHSVQHNGNIPFLVGGTGLYLRGLTEGLTELFSGDPIVREELKKELAENEGRQLLYDELVRVDPESAARIHPNDSQRLLRALEIYRTTGRPWSKHLAQEEKNKSLQNVLKIGLTCEREVLYERINTRTRLMVEQGLEQEVRMLLDQGYHGQLKSMQSIGYRHMVNYIEGRWSLEKALELLARDTRHYAKRQYTWFNKDPEIRWLAPAQRDEIFQCITAYVNKRITEHR
jgi:tRNA dimethylallyltransferase